MSTTLRDSDPIDSKSPENLYSTDVQVLDTDGGMAGPSQSTQNVSTPYKGSKEERKYRIKLDIFLLTFISVSQIIKYLDQQNINFAYASGMQEDLHLQKNELNYFLTYFNVGYCIFIIPSQIMISWFPPNFWLSGLELVWGVLTLGIAGAKSAKQIYAIRAFIGIAESSAYPGAITLLMSWYTPEEMAKRIGLYNSCQSIGGLMAGALQAAIMGTLDGRHGLAGWRWAFIINGIMTLIVGVMGIFFIPGWPERPNKLARWWLKPQDLAIAEDRVARTRRPSPKAINIPTLKKVLFNPVAYFTAAMYIGCLLAAWGSSYFNLFLKSLKNADGTPTWSVSALSAVPIGGYAINIGYTWICCILSDLLRTRWPFMLFTTVTSIPAEIILVKWNAPLGAKYYAYFQLFVLQTVSPIIWSWMSDMLPYDAGQRSVIIGWSIAFYYATNAWANPLIYPASQAPEYHVGWKVTLSVLLMSTCAVIGCTFYCKKVVEPRNKALAEQVAREIEAEHAAQHGYNQPNKRADEEEGLQN